MRGGGLSTPSGVVGLRNKVKMTFTRNKNGNLRSLCAVMIPNSYIL